MPDGRNGDGDGEGPDEEAGPDAPEKVEQDGDQDGDLSTSFLCKVIRAAPSCAFERPGAGTRLGGRDGQRFEVLGESGDGGMGFVVKAWDEQLRRVVALKFMLPERGLSDSELSLIRQEARAVARLDDENIVRIFDVDEWTLSSSRPGIPFIVMEFLEGELLATLVRRGKVGLRRALELMGALLSGLEHAHAQGVIHRDLKPGNVFILKDGKVKLLDFGLAHFTAAQGGPTPGMPRGGTPAYMAPEQWRGDHAQDARTDLWAAGIVLFEMLAGKHPFADVPPGELRQRVTGDGPIPSLRERVPELPEELDRILSQALARDPSKRFQSTRDFRERLRRLEERFCPPPRRSHSTAPVRRPVTVVSCLLSGHSDPRQPLDSEDLLELQGAFHGFCARVFDEHGGSVRSYSSGGVLACFGYPEAHEDDPERAVRAALRVSGLSAEELEGRSRFEPEVRVGVHTGVVVVDEVGPEPHRTVPSLQGEAPRIAVALAERAEPGTVSLSAATEELIRGAFESEPLGPLSVEGLSGPREVQAHCVVRKRDAPFRFERGHATGVLTPLVGREEELRRLVSLWHGAREGHGASVLVGGEPGIGKSRLIWELRQRVEGGKVFRGQCWAQFSNSPLFPIVEALQHVLPLALDASPEQRRDELGLKLRRLGMASEHVDALAQLLSLAVSADSPLPLLPPASQRERCFEALEALLFRIAEEGPVLAILEDAHWADHSTLELLGHVLPRLRTAKLLVVVSARPELAASWPRQPWTDEVWLERLDPHEVVSLAESTARGRALSPEQMAQLVAKTDGIPLFIQEMTRLLLEDGGEPRSVPATLRGLLMARLNPLSPRQRALAELGAVVGRSFPRSMLEALSGRDARTLDQELGPLCEAGLLERTVGDVDPWFEFRHALLQDAAYESMVRGTRRERHRQVAQHLEALYPRLVAERPELLAHHYTEAGMVEGAIPLWTKAGLLASARAAMVEAISHFSRALGLIESTPDPARFLKEELITRSILSVLLGAVRGEDSPEVARNQARVWELLAGGSDTPNVASLPSLITPIYFYFLQAKFEVARALATYVIGRGEQEADAELLLLGHRLNALIAWARGELRSARGSIEQALEVLPACGAPQEQLILPSGMDGRAAALSYAAMIYSPQGDVALARDTLRWALEVAEETGHAYTIATTWAHSGIARQYLREARELQTVSERAISLCAAEQIAPWLLFCRMLRSWAIAATGEPEQGLESMREALDEWRALGVAVSLPYLLGLLADIHLMLGQAEQVLSVVSEALGFAEQTDQRAHVAELLRLRGEALRRLGREPEAAVCFDQGLSLARRQGARLLELRAAVSRGRQRLQLGDPEGARGPLMAAYAMLAPGPECEDLRDARVVLASLEAEAPQAGP